MLVIASDETLSDGISKSVWLYITTIKEGASEKK
jgi:hypothetical protein